MGDELFIESVKKYPSPLVSASVESRTSFHSSAPLSSARLRLSGITYLFSQLCSSQLRSSPPQWNHIPLFTALLLSAPLVSASMEPQPYDDIGTCSHNAVTSPSGAASAPRATDTGFDSRDTVARPGPSSLLSAPTNNNSNNYVTRSGREVIAPDRWGSWGW
ncbi:uncharacterized protein LOC133525272 [Cydia pomonella]|uniref:uncharacterized protein LOC133525272 n=1 Tax=Cydia pomonella TaxID=82600 RepID=UPI002ADDB8AD|nr:uncharacterized protein LOC133525272 [Cydia pomonella]